MDDAPRFDAMSRAELIGLLNRHSDAADASSSEVRSELARRQFFTNAMLETIDVGIVSCDANGTNTHRNGAARTMLGLSDLSPDADHDAATARIDILDETGRRVDPEQFPLRRVLRGETIPDTDFSLGPQGGPYRDAVVRGSQITTPDEVVLGAVLTISDVSAERAALRQLNAERERLTQAQRLAQIGSFSWDRITDRYSFSPEIFRIWGLPPDADPAELSQRMIHPEDRPRVLEHWRYASHAGGEHSIDYRVVRPDGSVRHLRVSLEVQLDAAGDVLELQGTHLDVTDLTVARLEAVEANKLLTAILTATPDFTFVTALSTGAVIYGSPGKSVLGLTAAQMTELGPNLMSVLVHPDDLARLRAMNVAACDLADGAVLHLRYRAGNSDDTWHWLDRRVTPFRRDTVTGQVVEVLGVVRDVTDEHHTDLALRDREARLRALVTQVVDYAIIGLDAHGVIESWNDGAQRLKGYSSVQAIGMNFSVFYTVEDRAAGLPGRMLDAARTHGRAENKGWRVRADGTTFWADVVITVLRDELGQELGFVKVTRDLTSQHQLDAARESLFAAVSHDLRTPITAIKLYAEMMAERDEDNESGYARRIAARADHLATLVNTLFEYAKMRTQPTAITLEPLALAPLARSTVEGIGPVLHDHPVIVEDSALLAWADHTAMNRILENLLSNAAKYSPTGSPITIAFYESADRVRLTVTDQGRGIAPEDIDTIFIEFNRGRMAQADGGTGLGLASVQHLATMQGGRAWITSELGHGTTVTIELAAATNASASHAGDRTSTCRLGDGEIVSA